MSKMMENAVVVFVYWWSAVKKFFSAHFQKIAAFLEKVKAVIVKFLGGEKNAKWIASVLGKWTLIVLIFAVYSIVLCRAQYAKAERTYEEYYKGWYETQVAQYVSEKEAERIAEEERLNAPPSEEQVRRVQAEELARLLYGVKDNSTDDLRTLCWCVFNRVDNGAYPSTIEAVISQPSQWMGYNHSNVVLEDLYQIAYEEMTKWQDGSHRPVSNEYVFMNWSASGIVLRNTFNENAATRYWRIK